MNILKCINEMTIDFIKFIVEICKFKKYKRKNKILWN